MGWKKDYYSRLRLDEESQLFQSENWYHHFFSVFVDFDFLTFFLCICRIDFILFYQVK